VAQSGLTESQCYGTALAVAYSVQQTDLITAIKIETGVSLFMAMNNVYFRFVHLAEDDEFSTMPANLWMIGLRSHGVDQADFELFALAVSAINGCGLCISLHLQQLLKQDVPCKQVSGLLQP